MTESNFNNQAQNPMSEYLLKLQLIVSNTEFKDKAEAQKYETLETKIQGDKYVSAMLHKDIFESYTYNSHDVYTYLESKGYSEEKIFFLIKNPQMIPQTYKNELMSTARDEFVATYQEQNRYYLMLTGQPFPGSETEVAEEVVLIPDEFYEVYEKEGVLSRNHPVHEMPIKYQELFMNTKWYKETLEKYPNAKYLRYIGSNRIPIEVSRPARDGDILLINQNKLSTHHPVFGNVSVSYDIVHKFVSVYKETRNYVYQTLKGDFSDIYPNYDSFIRFLTIYLAIGNALNEFFKSSTSYIHMNNVTANNLFMLYGLPSVIMEGTSMIEFLKKFRLILMDKGTNIVYRVKDLVGYEYTDIYTLVMVKQQVFENGIPVYTYDENGNKVPKQRIVFRRLGTTEDNTSYFKFRESSKEYTVEEITSGDPRWWNTPEVEAMLQDMNYTLSNSKYIQLSTHLSMSDIWWQCVILLRGLLDNKLETQFTTLNVNYNINGKSEMSVFEAVLTLIILMNWQLVDFKGDCFNGNMYIPNSNENGRIACVDLLFNGLQNAARYQRGMSYKKGQIIGLPIYTKVPKYIDSGREDTEYVLKVSLANEKWYIATRDFTAVSSVSDDQAALNIDINATYALEVYGDEDILDPGAPEKLLLGGPYKIASFNFKIREENPTFYESIQDMEYLEPERFLPMLESVLNRETVNTGEVLMTDAKLIYEYLENKLRDCTIIQEFRQTTDVFAELFLVDPVRDWYDDSSFDIDDRLINDFGITALDLVSFKRFFNPHPSSPDFTVSYNGKSYGISLYTVLNSDVESIKINDEYPFTDNGFVNAFSTAVDKLVNPSSIDGSSLSENIKKNYKDIIKAKVWYDIGNDDGYPKTFLDLLMRTNSSLYSFLMNAKSSNNSDNLVMFMRAIIKALESYTNSPLVGLEFKVLGVENYFHILKEVITYFKSYMVEFTKEEFTYIFDGIFDNGGRPNMLKLLDEISNGAVNVVPHDSLTLYDVSRADVHSAMKDDVSGVMYDDALFRIEATYQTLLETGYEIWYDDGKRILRTPIEGINPDMKIVANIVSTKEKDSVAYKIIINTNNLDVVPPNYLKDTK